MKKISALIISAMIAAAALCCCISAFDANDYDYGGNYDYDYGGYSSYDDDDYSYGGGYSSYDDDDHHYSGGSGGSMTWEETLITIAVVVVVLIVGGIWANLPDKKGKNGKKGGSYTPPPPSRKKTVQVPNRNVDVRDAVRQFDPSFEYTPMIDLAKKVFVDIQNAWCARDLEPVRNVMHTNLYNTTMKQVQSKIDQHVTYHYENINIKNAYLTGYVRDKDYEYVTVYLNTEYIDYQVNDDTGEIIRGDRETMWHLRYLMKFMRSTASVNATAGDGKHCPNCGAPLDMTSSGRCEYCGSTVTSGSFDWLLSEFTSVRDDTKDDGIRIS